MMYVIEQIKDFNHRSWELTKKQKLLIDKLTSNEELKERYKEYGLCKEYKQPNTSRDWCWSCNAKHFQQNFKNWTSGNSDVDKLIQDSQLNAKDCPKKLELINLKILNMLQGEVLEQYIKNIGRMDILINGIMKLINGTDTIVVGM